MALVAVVLAVVAGLIAPSPSTGAPNPTRPKQRHEIKLVKPERVTRAGAAPHAAPKNIRVGTKSANGGANADDPIDMKLLVLCADGNETDYPAIRAFLDQLGVPYETMLATQTTLTPDKLWDGGVHGYYQGIILCTGDLVYFDPATNSWPSAFDQAEWAALWDYEARFRIRQVTSFTVPGGAPDSYGMGWGGFQDTLVNPLNATLTTAGRQVFSYLNPNNPVTISGAWTYLGQPATGCSSDPACVTTPLLVSGQNIIATTTRYSDGRENLAVTAANNPHLRHSMLLSYGIVNWVTKGLFLGERHVTFNAQVDDVLIEDDIWDVNSNSDATGLTYRMSGADLTAVANWQQAIRARYATTSTLMLEHAFNAEGASGIYAPDTLTPAVLANKNNFNWVSHTWSHKELDNPCEPEVDCASTVAAIRDELRRNHQWATSTLKSNRYKREAMVQPNISGLYNANFYSAASAFGITSVISDTSRAMQGPCLVSPCTATWSNPSPNTGFTSVQAPTLLVVPRYPSNLFYNLSTPEEWVDEYNCFYGPNATCAGGAWRFWDHDLSYAEILDQESEFLLSYLLKWSLNPLMFHQPNLRAYDGTHSLLGDLIDVTMAKYNQVYNLPVVNLRQTDIATRMREWMDYKASGVRGSLVPCTATTPASFILTSPKATTVPVTGVRFGSRTETYGGQRISYVTLRANTPVTVPLTTCP